MTLSRSFLSERFLERMMDGPDRHNGLGLDKERDERSTFKRKVTTDSDQRSWNEGKGEMVQGNILAIFRIFHRIMVRDW